MAKKLHRKFSTKDYVGFLVSICSGPAQRLQEWEHVALLF